MIYPIRFTAKRGELFKLYWMNVVMGMVTLGIYRFWATVKMSKFLYGNIQLDGRGFQYHATGKELFIGFLKGMAIVLPIFALLVGAGIAFTKWLGPTWGIVAIYAMVFPAILLINPWVMVAKQRFWLARTSWSNVRFRFNGTYKPALAIIVKGNLLTVLTLGFYMPFFTNHLQKFLVENTQLGNRSFQYDGQGKDLFWIFLKGFFFTILTLGIYYPWFAANLNRYVLEHMSIDGGQIHCSLTGGQMFGMMLKSLLISVGTLGIAFPIAMHITLETYWESISLECEPTLLEGILGSPDTGASALAGGLEEAAEVVDAISGAF